MRAQRAAWRASRVGGSAAARGGGGIDLPSSRSVKVFVELVGLPLRDPARVGKSRGDASTEEHLCLVTGWTCSACATA